MEATAVKEWPWKHTTPFEESPERVVRIPIKIDYGYPKWEVKQFPQFKRCWRNVVQRCTNPIDKRYKYYSKVGVCDEWLDFNNFARDMWSSYFEHAKIHGKDNSIDRIDNAKGYSKENCQWLTMKENQTKKIKKESVLFRSNCWRCGKELLRRTKRNRTHCKEMCWTPEQQAEHRRAHMREFYHKSPSRKKAQREASKRYLNKIKGTPQGEKLKKLQSQYSHNWLKKKMATDPNFATQFRFKHALSAKRHYHENMSNPDFIAKIREKGRKNYWKNPEKFKARARENYKKLKLLKEGEV